MLTLDTYIRVRNQIKNIVNDLKGDTDIQSKIGKSGNLSRAGIGGKCAEITATAQK
mgnify:CR=1 FL=1